MVLARKRSAFPVRAGVLGYDDVVGSRLKIFRALCQVQSEIGADSELSLFQFFQAGIYCVRITVNDQDAAEAGSCEEPYAPAGHRPD